jgi:thioredoxin 2
MVAPGVARAAGEFAGRLKVVKVDVDAAPSVAVRYDARSIPTLLLLRDGHVVSRQVGAVGPDRLVAWAGAALTDQGAAAGR